MAESNEQAGFTNRFGLRSLLVLILLVSFSLSPLAPWNYSAARQRRTVAALLNAGVDSFDIYFEQGDDPEDFVPPVPQFLQRFFDIHRFRNVLAVHLRAATDEQIHLLAGLPRLRRVFLTPHTDDCSEAGLCELQSLRALQWLQVDLEVAPINDTPPISDRALVAISRLAKLKTLSLECGPNVTDAGLASLQRLRGLETLRIQCGPRISDQGLATLSALSQLRGLNVEINDQPDAVYPDTEYQTISDAPSASKRGRNWGWLASLTQLHWLRITGGMPFLDTNGVPRGKWQQLTRLIVENDGGLTDAGLAEIGKLPALRVLVLKCTNGKETDRGWEHLGALSHLKTIDAHVGPDISDAAISSLSTCPLVAFRLHLNDQVTGVGLQKLNALECLELDFTARTANAPPFRFCIPPGVKYLNIDGRNLLTDNDLAEISQVQSLRTLVLERCGQITDRGIEQLQAIKQLDGLGVLWCDQITGAGIAVLQAALPHCRVEVFPGGAAYAIPGDGFDSYVNKFH